MKQYHDLLKQILGKGKVQYDPRTEEHVLGLSAWQSTYDLSEGFPLVTTKNVPIRLLTEELFWKARGERNVKSLFDRNVHIWDANAFDRHLKTQGLKEAIPKHTQKWEEEFTVYKERLATDSEFAAVAGDLGPVYGFQWRHWVDKNGKETDQLKNLLKGIKEKPGSRYHILSSWNVGDLPEMAIGPCPFWHQFTVYGKTLDLTQVQRSCDVFLGVPFNIAQDALLLGMVAKETGLKAGSFNHSYINVHSYLGVKPRAEFWENPENVAEFQRRFTSTSDYKALKEWYLSNAPPESPGNERKDHIPSILEQLSITPQKLPTLQITDGNFLDLIERPAQNVVRIEGYNPAKWDSKAYQAA